MSKISVSCFALSLDGYGAGPNQDEQNPLGRNGIGLHSWFFPTRSFQSMHGQAGGGTTGVDDDFARRGGENVGAWIMGRNMFGPVRGPWPNEQWRGWWGENPPYHVPVFVLTHHPRRPLEMEGGTTFHFVTGGIEEALRRAREAAGAADVRLGGGAATIRQYLRARLVDELHIAISPVLLGSGESLFDGIDMDALGYRVEEHVPTAAATHVVLRRAAGAGAGGMTTTSGAGGAAGSATGIGGAAPTGGASGSSGGTSGSGGAGGATRGTGGSTGTGGRAGQGGSGGAQTGMGGAGGSSAAAVPSAGCGKTRTLQDGNRTIMSSGMSRTYNLKTPSNYDNQHPYRVIFMFHWNFGSINSIVNPPEADHNTDRPYYGFADLSGDTTIFVVPMGLNDTGGAGWANPNNRDVIFTDDMLSAITADLCIDTSRVFTTGFSYGASMSYQLACIRPTKFRAALVYEAGTLSGQNPALCTTPIAWFQSEGIDDQTLAYATAGLPILSIFSRVNGCTAMTPPTPPTNGHTCVSFQGCSSGHPARFCNFGSGENNPFNPSLRGHYPVPKDPGQTTSWVPMEAWSFITQF